MVPERPLTLAPPSPPVDDPPPHLLTSFPMAQELIDGVKIKPLKLIPDERGVLAELVRRDDPMFTKFGQVYMTTAYPGVVKGWHYHKIQIDNFSCVRGMIKLVLYDDREKSSTKGKVNEFFLGF